MRRLPQPFIACVHGPACGGGFALALASDVRLAGESARMNAAFIKIGLSACDIGVSYFLPRLVGASLASELLLTGKFIDADRALRVGLVSEVMPDAELESAARKLAGEMLGLHVKQFVNEIHGLGLLAIPETLFGAQNQCVHIVGFFSQDSLQREMRRRKKALLQQEFCLIYSSFQVFIHAKLQVMP
jgi:enoyl-CoA hydratase/carnithine racemase